MKLSDLKTRNMHADKFEIVWPSGAVEIAIKVAGEWEFDKAWTPECSGITDEEIEFGENMSQSDFELLRKGTV